MACCSLRLSQDAPCSGACQWIAAGLSPGDLMQTAAVPASMRRHWLQWTPNHYWTRQCLHICPVACLTSPSLLDSPTDLMQTAAFVVSLDPGECVAIGCNSPDCMRSTSFGHFTPSWSAGVCLLLLLLQTAGVSQGCTSPQYLGITNTENWAGLILAFVGLGLLC
jgi:hypothetical protein